MKISVIIPCYNEIKTIEIILKKIRKLNFKNLEIILVDDCSNDGTRELIKSSLIHLCNEVIFHKFNSGKGACIQSALTKITGDIVIIQDADLEYDPDDYKKLIDPMLLNNKIEIVYGSRVLGQKRYKNKNFLSIYRIFFNHILTITSNILNKQHLTDAHTCYKVFRRDTLKKIQLIEKDFSFCPEVTTKISRLNIKIHEVPISYNGRSVSDGKKIRFKDGIKAIYVLFKYRFF